MATNTVHVTERRVKERYDQQCRHTCTCMKRKHGSDCSVQGLSIHYIVRIHCWSCKLDAHTRVRVWLARLTLLVVAIIVSPGYMCLCTVAEEESLKEEFLAQHGVLEEYIAFDGR